MAKNNGERPSAVVLVRFSALGDVAIPIPALYDLAVSHPDLKVVMVTRSWMAKMMVNRPANLEVVGVDLNDYKGPRGMARLVGELTRRYDVKAFVDLHDVLRTRMMSLFMRLRGVRVSTIDKGRRDKKRLVNVGAEAFGRDLKPMSARYRDAIERAGYRLESHFTTLFPDAKRPVSPRRIGIAPFAAHVGKIYPTDKLYSVVKLLAEDTDNEIYLFGAGDDENAILTQWATRFDNVTNLAAERRGLAEELRLMSTLDVMVAMDSGNMHLASVAGTPRVISVWGQTHPAAGFIPWHADPADYVQVEMSCRPCSVFGNRPCNHGDYPCLNDITVQTLYKKIKTTLTPLQTEDD